MSLAFQVLQYLSHFNKYFLFVAVLCDLSLMKRAIPALSSLNDCAKGNQMVINSKAPE